MSGQPSRLRITSTHSDPVGRPRLTVPTSGYWGLALGAAWDAETAHLGQLILDVRRLDQLKAYTELNETSSWPRESGSPRSTTHPSLTSIIRVQEGDRLQGEISLHDQAPPHPNGDIRHKQDARVLHHNLSGRRGVSRSREKYAGCVWSMAGQSEWITPLSLVHSCLTVALTG